ncbi:MAG: hypothetical protein KUL86_06725 [Castellaniella sp.]|nr:hypothetical protein [Castellaniella sp.]
MNSTLSVTVDSEPLMSCMASLKQFLDVSLEVRHRFLSLGDALTQARSLNLDDGSAVRAGEFRIVLKPSDGLTQLLSACLAGDFDDV